MNMLTMYTPLRGDLGIQPRLQNADSFSKALVVALKCVEELVRRDNETAMVEQHTRTIRGRVRESCRSVYKMMKPKMMI